jgi:ubiquinone biosynthesis protein Coq4
MSRPRRNRLREAGRALAFASGAAVSSVPSFELADVLAGSRMARLVRRVRRSPGGAELLARRAPLDAGACELGDLLRLPSGTFGYEYAQWKVDLRLEREVAPGGDGLRDADQRCLRRRLLEVHDHWHVLSGYNCDAAGELGMLAFTLGQIREPGIALLLGAALCEDAARSLARRRFGSPLAPYLWHAFWRGLRARFLLPVALEDYLWLPIGSVRQRLGIEPSQSSLTPAALPPVGVTSGSASA